MEVNKRLCHAIKARDCEEVRTLLKQGAIPLSRIDDDSYFTPWNWLYLCDSYSITSILLAHCPKAVNYRISGLCDETLLFGAILTENKIKIRLLIEKGADINIMNENGYTPLYYAVRLSSKETDTLIPLLLDLGANITIGMKRFNRFEEKYRKYFYDHLYDFLVESQELGDLPELKKQTERILKLHEGHPISRKLLEKVNEIRYDYGLDLEDDLEEGGEEEENIKESQEKGKISDKDQQDLNKNLPNDQTDSTIFTKDE